MYPWKISWHKWEHKRSKTITHLYNTSEGEMKAFSGLWNLKRALNWIFHQVRTIFSSIFGNKLFSTITSVSRFVFLSCCFRFSDIRSCTERFQNDGVTVLCDVSRCSIITGQIFIAQWIPFIRWKPLPYKGWSSFLEV